MSHFCRIAAGFVLLGLLGCSEKSPTPQDVSTRFHALLDTLDTDAPGASLQTLEAFLKENQHYTIADSVQDQIVIRRGEMHGRYHEARELARDGEFDRAERMLQDLSLAQDTEDGTSAQQHLEFEFYMEKAKWLLVRQRFDESEAVARMLLTRDLTRFQRDQVEQVLDFVSNVDGAVAMGEKSKAQAACRQLIVLLASRFADEGRYPESLSLSDLERIDPYSSRTITSALASIEDYRTWEDKYSLVAVSKQGERFKIVNGTIEN